MTSIGEHLDNYFSSLNPITRKICNDLENIKKAYGENEWNNLDSIRQEEILANYMISDEIREKYAHMERNEPPESFPRLRVNGGEKIVVDFENEDGWTWQDEHSGPFTWMNKSQQDLSLDDLDNLEEQVKKHKRGVSRSPDRDAANKRQWEQTANQPGNDEAAHTADEIFQKFGIAFSFGQDQESSQSTPEPAHEPEIIHDQYPSSSLGPDESSDSHSAYGTLLRDDNLSEAYDVSSHRTSTLSTISSTSSTKKKSKSRGSKTEAELYLMDEPELQMGSYGEQVSPVYLEDPGESSTDHESSFNTTAQYNYDIDIQPDSPSVLGSTVVAEPTSPVVSSQPTSLHTEWHTETFTNQDSPQPQSPQANDLDEGDSSPMKTGFDFLDNW